MIAFVAFLLLLGAGFDAFYRRRRRRRTCRSARLPPSASGRCPALASYYNGDRAVLASTAAAPIEELAAARPTTTRLKLRQLENVVDEMAIAAGLPRPTRLRRARSGSECVCDRPRAGAFVDRGHARPAGYAQSRGTPGRRRARDEPHQESGHPRDDASLPRWSARSRCCRTGRGGACDGAAARAGATTRAAGRVRRRSCFFVVWLVAILLAPLVAQVLAMMVSRRREYLADASGAELTRNPIGLARALEKIEGATAPTRGDQARVGASVHHRSARPSDEHQGRTLVRSVRVASADGGAHRGAEGDGLRKLVDAAIPVVRAAARIDVELLTHAVDLPSQIAVLELAERVRCASVLRYRYATTRPPRCVAFATPPPAPDSEA